MSFVTLLGIAPCLFAISITDAINKRMVNAEFTSSGVHRGKSVLLAVENLTNQNLELEVPIGTYLDHESEGYQDHVIVQDYIFVLKPQSKDDRPLHALCVESFNACPQNGSKFFIKPYDNKKVLELCKLLKETQEYEYTAQTAMWELINGGDPNAVEGGNGENVNKIREFLAKELNKKALPYDASDYDRPLQGSGYNLSLWVEGNWYLREIKGGETVEYGIFDQDNNPISEIKKDQTQPNFWKKHNVAFRFDLNGLDTNTKYYLQIKVDGVIRKEWMYRYQG